jgi:hypothetical protein
MQTLALDTTDLTTFPQVSPEDLATLTKAAGTLSSSRIAWLPTFGCALLALQPLDAAGLDLQLLPGHLTLHLVCLDGWQFSMHR